MAVAIMKAILHKDLRTVWNVVTNLEQYAWRSDITRIEFDEEHDKFIEYSKDGYATTFTITVFEVMKRYEFDIENSNMSGHWIGEFKQCEDGVEIVFTEDVTPKKMIMKPFVKAYLKKQQATYVADLKKVLGE